MGVAPISNPSPKFFFRNWALKLLYPYGALTSYKTKQGYNEPQAVYFIAAILQSINPIWSKYLGKTFFGQIFVWVE